MLRKNDRPNGVALSGLIPRPPRKTRSCNNDSYDPEELIKKFHPNNSRFVMQLFARVYETLYSPGEIEITNK